MNGLGRLSEGPVAFDRYVLSVEERRLLRDGKRVQISPKAFELLAILIAHYPAAVSRDRLYELLWPDGFVEDGNLTQTVYMVRRLLDPDGDGRRFVQTIPRQGYRFALAVQPLAEKNQRRKALRTSFLRAAACFALIAVTLGLGGSSLAPAAFGLSPEAASAYALGVYHWNLRTDAELQRSVGYFKQTVRLAPRSALGYSGLAQAYAIEADTEHATPKTKRFIRLAELNRDEALRLDPNSGEAHTVAAFIAYRFQNNFALSEREFQRAFAARPDYATAHQWHAILRFAQGDLEASVRELETAHRLDPTSEVISRWLGIGYYYVHRPNDAIAVLSETIAIEPEDVGAWLQLASAQEQRGSLKDALGTLKHVRRNTPEKGPYVALLEARLKVLSQHGFADPATIAQVNRIAASRSVDNGSMAYFFVAAGMRERALQLLRSSHDSSKLDISMVRNDPRFDPLRSDPRFAQIFN